MSDRLPGVVLVVPALLRVAASCGSSSSGSSGSEQEGGTESSSGSSGGMDGSATDGPAGSSCAKASAACTCSNNGCNVGSYYLYDNQWNCGSGAPVKCGPESAYGCTNGGGTVSFVVTSNQPAGNTGVLSYPAMQDNFGNKPALGSFKSITATFQETSPTSATTRSPGTAGSTATRTSSWSGSTTTTRLRAATRSPRTCRSMDALGTCGGARRAARADQLRDRDLLDQWAGRDVDSRRLLGHGELIRVGADTIDRPGPRG
jgi:hypothetical protein